MITLYAGSSSGGFSIETPSDADGDLRPFLLRVAKILRVRGNAQAAELLLKYPFRLFGATNDFNDEFSVLVATVPLGRYEELRKLGSDRAMKSEFRVIADVASELGTYVRFIAAQLDDASGNEETPGLTKGEVQKLVSMYIGVEGGYLGDFNYRAHHEFYLELDLDINPYDYAGTTRERFIQILTESPPDVQARILRGIVEKYPVGTSPLRTQARAELIGSWIRRLEGRGVVAAATPQITTAVVERALMDAANLLKTSGPTSAVDRVHTALHGWMKAACLDAAIPLGTDPNINETFSALRDHHPRLNSADARASEAVKILRALSKIIDVLNTFRNTKSVAHPNEELLEEPEAMLVINAAQTLLHYLDAKLQP
jgi:hypothetical protein